MITIITTGSITLCVYILAGFYILLINPRNKVNILFFIITLCLAANNFLIILIHQIPDQSTALLIYRTGTSLATLIYTLLIFLFVRISNIFQIYNIDRIKKIFLGILVFFQTFLIYRNYALPEFVELVKSSGMWRATFIYDSVHFTLVMIYWSISTFIFVLIMVLWRIKSTSKREKRQATVLLVSLFLGGITLVIHQFFIFHIFKLVKDVAAGNVSLIFFVWISGIGYCISRYRFLSITPEYLSKELISNIDELVIIISMDKKIVTLNNKAKELINEISIDKEKDFLAIINENKSTKSKISDLLEGKEESFNSRIQYLNNRNQKKYIEARFSIIKDKFKDALGILVIAKENRELKHLKERYNLTDRQMEIVIMVLSGLSNKELATNLMISEKTVENHLINIYNKLGVNNKIELYNLTQEYYNDSK